MTAGKVKKQSGPNSRLNLSHILESHKTKTTNQRSIKVNILQQKQNLLHHIWQHTTSKSKKVEE